jgi:hypothetical protein
VCEVLLPPQLSKKETAKKMAVKQERMRFISRDTPRAARCRCPAQVLEKSDRERITAPGRKEE